MSDLAATNCGGCGGCGDNCNSIVWIIILLLLFDGNNGCGCNNGCGNGCNSFWIIILLFFCCGCGNGTNFLNGFGCGCNSGCGCNNDYYNDNAALYEAECVARAALRRRNRENRCAREFVRCMKNARCGY